MAKSYAGERREDAIDIENQEGKRRVKEFFYKLHFKTKEA